ncbi:stringent starvation protein B [Candidatus Erwinia haradaeae]|uniref:Stringent starvation protein B n=1 Tax=Candidatus Erwinia haradaeae TaxID=1922217 RepID=A0A803FT21_9GAMM|nr:ClpXP protease specificity-enhancing factor SspB [Candidatus Erwinia haradaeae]VFP87490.1 Stringent starvation protein B [Candidatus Erwinia haradaeae]
MIKSQFTDQRPYLLRAWYQWFIDNNLTPCILVNINFPSIIVPISYTSNGQIILNISPRSVENLEIKNDKVSFHTCFNGIVHAISLPPISIQAIYSVENGIGTNFMNHREDADRTVSQSQKGCKISPVTIESDVDNVSSFKNKHTNQNLDKKKTVSDVKNPSILRLIK